MSPALPLTPPHTPATSLTPSSSIHTATSTDSDTDPDTDNSPSRFLLVSHVPRNADSDSIKRVFTTLVPPSSPPHTRTEHIKGIFIRLQASEGRIVIAFYDIRNAAAVVAAVAEAGEAVRLSALLGGSPPPAIQCRFVSVPELEKLIGKYPFVDSNTGSFVLYLESITNTQQSDSEYKDRIRAALAQYGDIRTFTAVDDPLQCDSTTQVIHVEFHDVREARAACVALNGRVVAGYKFRIFGQSDSLDDAKADDHHTMRGKDIGAVHTTEKNCIPFPKTPVGPGSNERDEDKSEGIQNAVRTVKQRPRSASAGTHANATDSPPQALDTTSLAFIPADTKHTESKPNGHAHIVHGPAQIHDVFGRRCSNQLLFDAARRPIEQLSPLCKPVVNVRANKPERLRRSLSTDARENGDFAERTETGQVIGVGDEWLDLDDACASNGQMHVHAHPYAYAPQQQQQLQYYFPSLSPVPASDMALEGACGVYFQPPPASFYTPSPTLRFSQPQSVQTGPPMGYAGYDYDSHLQHGTHGGFLLPAGARTGAASGIGAGWGLDHESRQEYWFNGASATAASYYPATHPPPHPTGHHHSHHTQQLVAPYTLRGGHPNAHTRPELFAPYAYPSASCASPIPFQTVASGMSLGAGPPQLSLQIPGIPLGVQASQTPMPIQMQMGMSTGLSRQVPALGHEINVGIAGGSAANAASINAGVAAGTGMERNQLNLARIADGQDTRTTVMIKNIPNKMSDKDLLAYIWRVCPRKIDFLYLRMDFRNECNVGYAFVNFIYVEDLLKFATERLDVKWNMFSSEKVLHMSYANYQGKEALIEKFKNSCIMDEREAWRPKIFYSEPGPNQGLPEPFPPPTHFRRKERSSHNRGALFVPGIASATHRQDRQQGSSGGHGYKRAYHQGIAHNSGFEGVGQQQHPIQSQKEQKQLRDDEEEVQYQGHVQSSEGSLSNGSVFTGTGVGNEAVPGPEVHGEHTSRGSLGPPIYPGPRSANPNQQRSSR